MARIAFVVPRFHTNLYHATAALIAAGHEVSILVNLTGTGEDHRHVTPVVLGRQPEPGAVEAALKAARPDIVFIRTAHELSRQAALAARKLRLRAMRYDLLPLGDMPTLKQRLLHRWRGLPPGRITPVRSAGDRTERQGKARYMPWPVAPAGGVEVTDAVLRASPVPVLCVAKFGNPRKNHLALIDALAALGGGEAARLTLVGSAPRDNQDGGAAYFQEVQTRADTCDWIDIRVHVPYAEMPQLYASHAICVLPSFDEPLGISPVEGMAFGTIPVISAQSGSAGYLTDGVDGLCVDVAKEGALQSALAPLLRDPKLRQRLSAATRQTWAKDLSPKRFVTRMEALIAEG
ncbi:glycosyltransferase family 4 protein [Thalassococcus sp. BH17M4-6]|uniref:glycosyltransferase family 4 protein n=1 Tax=Thalassococcus sp. BH17M4-6 TaxID=3413148 RepID=UPI003BB9C9FC